MPASRRLFRQGARTDLHRTLQEFRWGCSTGRRPMMHGMATGIQDVAKSIMDAGCSQAADQWSAAHTCPAGIPSARLLKQTSGHKLRSISRPHGATHNLPMELNTRQAASQIAATSTTTFANHCPVLPAQLHRHSQQGAHCRLTLLCPCTLPVLGSLSGLSIGGSSATRCIIAARCAYTT